MVILASTFPHRTKRKIRSVLPSYNCSHPGAKIPNFTRSPGVGAVGNRCSSSSSSFNGIQEEKYFPLKDKKSKIELKEGKNKRK